ncbi:hypothetical protein DPEC_G00089780 [Dallia pectoralis]|uniref:Uncharacterized protein n=1 Tax=Dallia pectoralis TaxID=75939 RepID=A0ACC2H182_DALPE|nr:hypothetical protein DPEC_G00089780 [Dallia pectoralis]
MRIAIHKRPKPGGTFSWSPLKAVPGNEDHEVWKGTVSTAEGGAGSGFASQLDVKHSIA